MNFKCSGTPVGNHCCSRSSQNGIEELKDQITSHAPICKPLNKVEDRVKKNVCNVKNEQ
jgi:hypothetical protein